MSIRLVAKIIVGTNESFARHPRRRPRRRGEKTESILA